ncbi:MAG: type IV secretion system DNA-binding domain-containing protein [bacterium]|nr:type IV secretion system DNA-binding domain-containing protein [bacterium]
MDYEKTIDKKQLTIIGKTNWRNSNQAFGILDKDRLGHIYSIGKTGTGKSTLLINMAISDITKGKGLALIDPHGESALTVLEHIPKDRICDVIYFNPADSDFPLAFNPLRNVHPQHFHIVTSGLISTFKKIWGDSWGPRLEHILRFSILTILEYQRGSLLDIHYILTDGFFRKKVLVHIQNPEVLHFWFNEFDKMTSTLKAESISPILNKIGVFIANPLMRNIVGQSTRGLRFQEIMDSGKILIANLSKGQIGEDTSTILGSLLVTNMQLSALYRARIPEHKRKPFYLYVDEVQSFISPSFGEMLSECRKYGLSVFLTNQHLNQLPESLQLSILGNVGTIISFRVGSNDGFVLSKEFYPYFTIEDFINLPRYSIYLKLLIDGTTSKPFSADTLPLPIVTTHYLQEIIEYSRKTYAKPKSIVEKEIERTIPMQEQIQSPLFQI